MSILAEEDFTPSRSLTDPVWRMLSGTLIFGAGVFVCGAVGTFDAADPSLNTATARAATNLFGTFGAGFADLARQTLGWASWCGGLAAMVGGAMRAVLIGRPRLRRWGLGAASVPLAAACFGAWPLPSDWPHAAGLGGFLGDGLHHLISMPFAALLIPLPGLWAALIAGAGALACALAAMGFRRDDALLLQDQAQRTGAKLSRHAVGVSTGLGGWLARRLARRNSTHSPVDDFADAAPRSGTGMGTGERIIVPGPGSSPAHTPSPQPAQTRAPSPTRAAQRSAVEPTASAGTAARATAQGTTRATAAVAAPPPAPTFHLPPLELLQTPPARKTAIDETALLARAAELHRVLSEYGVKGRVTEVRPGPVVTLFEFEPAAGVRSARVIALADDIARSMNAKAARVAVVTGKNAIGIELPNEKRETVYSRALLQSRAFAQTKARLPLALGEDIGGEPAVVELAKMPHLLVAGTTGSGKSVGINMMILSLLYRLTPEQCRFIMIDPKMLELSVYDNIPHLLAPVVTDPQKAVTALKWAVREMESRNELMAKAQVRNLASFNAKVEEYLREGKALTRMVQTGYDSDGKPIREFEEIPLKALPNIVVIIDEMADLMLVAGKEIEACVQRLAQMARAAGIHVIMATQRPSVNVITGVIKANFPSRISFMVTNKIDSRTILNEQGAEQLLGQGDMLLQIPGDKTIRVHGAFVSDEEVQAVVAYLREQGEPDYRLDVLEELPIPGEDDGDGSPVMDARFGEDGAGGGSEEDLYRQAVRVVLTDQRASTSYVQRRMKIGYNRAASLMERMEKDGIVSPANPTGKREILKATMQEAEED